MRMSERTRVAIEKLRSEYRGMVFSSSELERVCEVALNALIWYNAVEVVRSTCLIPVSVAELVRRLNECAGDNLYGCDWKYEEIDGQAFEVVTEILYRVL